MIGNVRVFCVDEKPKEKEKKNENQNKSLTKDYTFT